MTDWQNAILPIDATIRDAAESLNKSALQICLVISETDELRGVVTDGDIRRGLLAGLSLEAPVKKIMNTSFTYGLDSDADATILQVMTRNEFRQLPILDKHGKLKDLKTLMRLVSPLEKENWVVLMAGGLGSRLRPLTEECPKPLLPVGGKPILETIIDQFMDQGFKCFYISLNYKGGMIRNYFGDGSRIGVTIKYIQEKQKLGTAGALGLLPRQPDAPVFVMNGDLLTRINFQEMLTFHEEQQVSATMAVRMFDMQVPYGVVNVEKSLVTAIQEKPVYQFFVNAGIYILSPQVIQDLPKNEYLDMPTLIEGLQKQGKKVAAFPVHEYWMDIGQKQDFEQANTDYCFHFTREEKDS
jgi:dTDP-glucose pyrophosphorylase